jgi:hypothetical protein
VLARPQAALARGAAVWVGIDAARAAAFARG